MSLHDLPTHQLGGSPRVLRRPARARTHGWSRPRAARCEADGGLGVATADGLGQVSDCAGEAMNAAEDDDAVTDRHTGRRLGRGDSLMRDLSEAGARRLAHEQPVSRGADEVTEHSAGLD
jgi:hypothetical protein